jgi:hypothetical protein
MHCFKRLIASVLIASTTLMGLPLTAHAGLVGTEEALTSTAAAAEREKVDAFMQREDVRAALQARGVSPEAATERVRALSQDEVSQLALHIDQAPAAGADVLGITDQGLSLHPHHALRHGAWQAWPWQAWV